jgi:meiotically up-regulated gene 157 (Mug157) protein
VAALFAFVVLAMLHFAAMNWETVRQEREEDPEGATQLHIYGHQGEQELEGISKLHLYSKAEEQDLEGANKLHIYNKRQADPEGATQLQEEQMDSEGATQLHLHTNMMEEEGMLGDERPSYSRNLRTPHPLGNEEGAGIEDAPHKESQHDKKIADEESPAYLEKLQALSKNGKQAVDFRRFKTEMEKLEDYSPYEPILVRHKFEQIDANGNDYADVRRDFFSAALQKTGDSSGAAAKEAAAAAPAPAAADADAKLEAKLRRKIRKIFDGMDFDKDGTITHAEHQEFDERSGVDFSDPMDAAKVKVRMDAAWAKVDVNHDGSINLEEFTRLQLPAMKKAKQAKKRKQAEALLQKQAAEAKAADDTPTPTPTRKPTQPTRKPTHRPTREPTPVPRPKPLKEYTWSDAPSTSVDLLMGRRRSFPVQHIADVSSLEKMQGPQVLKHHRIRGGAYWPLGQDSETASQMATRLFWHTASVATHVLDDGTSFVFTGDIDDLWLRDSAAQVNPYIIYLETHQNEHLERMVSGLILRSAFYINYDAYANAFREDTSYVFSTEQKTKLGRYGYIATYDYELDSGCYFIRMLYTFCSARPESKVCKSTIVVEAVRTMVSVWIAEQHHEDDAFADGWIPYNYPQLKRNGKGPRSTYTGMTWTAARPSDDVSQYSYLIPSNAFAVVALGYVAKLAQKWETAGDLVQKANKLKAEIQRGIEEFGIVQHPLYGKIYAYEVDGLGNVNVMDDANVPSLLSLPYLGYEYDSEVYANTRRFLLSADNPHFKCSLHNNICGIGSPHTEREIRNGIWPMAQLMQGLTSSDPEEKVEMLRQVMESDGGTGWMHESYNPDNSNKYTRPWFCWVDSLFAELVMSLVPKGDVPAWAPTEWFDRAQRNCTKVGCHLDLMEKEAWQAQLSDLSLKHSRTHALSQEAMRKQAQGRPGARVGGLITGQGVGL